MDKKVKYKELAEKALQQALKEDEYSLLCIDSQLASLTNHEEIKRIFNTKKKFKNLLEKFCPFFIEIENKKDLPILLENVKCLVTQIYNNLESEKLKPTQVAFIILLMGTFSSSRWVRDNLKERVNEFPVATYVVVQAYIIHDIEPEIFVEFCQKLNNVF